MTLEDLELLTDEELEERVHNFKAEEASIINNQGRSAQIEYLWGYVCLYQNYLDNQK